MTLNGKVEGSMTKKLKDLLEDVVEKYEAYGLAEVEFKSARWAVIKHLNNHYDTIEKHRDEDIKEYEPMPPWLVGMSCVDTDYNDESRVSKITINDIFDPLDDGSKPRRSYDR